MSAGRHQRLLAESSALKLRAGSLLVSPKEAERFDGVVLLHDAARLEDHALRLLDDPTPETRLRFAIEKCGCLIDAGDPLGAADAWEEIILSSLETAPAIATSMRARIDDTYARSQRAFSSFIARRPVTISTLLGLFQPARRVAPARLEATARALVSAMPGVARFWMALAAHARDQRVVRKAVTRSRRLLGWSAPAEPRFRTQIIGSAAIPGAKIDPTRPLPRLPRSSAA